MWSDIQSSPQSFVGAPWQVCFLLLTLGSLALFAFIGSRRLGPLLQSAPDPRFSNLWPRTANVIRYWLAQWKQPRYLLAGLLHIVIFFGFLVLAARTLSLVLIGPLGRTDVSIVPAALAGAYLAIKDYFATLVFLACVTAAVRRTVFQPKRYAVPPRFGKPHTAEAVVILGLIATLMLSESLFEACHTAIVARFGTGAEPVTPFTLAWFWYTHLGYVSELSLAKLRLFSYLVHEITFFSFLCLLPYGKHFHVLTSLFNVFFAKVDREQLKPARWGATEEEIAAAQSLGVKEFQDFTWKQMLDFYSCADCGRCSDQCPSNATGRPLSPRFFNLKGRDYAFQHYPILHRAGNGAMLMRDVYSDDEIWSCTTCGACEHECPLLVEFIDKIVDLRRGLIDDGRVPTTVQKALRSLESRGNPYGKLEKKRADWTKDAVFLGTCQVPVVNGAATDTLYFVDSMTSFDDRMQSIARSSARLLKHLGQSFAILGTAEKDSGHEVRRFGEEMLFFALRDHNLAAIEASGARRIVTSDPHAYNALKHDYSGVPPVQHISEVIAEAVNAGSLQFAPVEDRNAVYAFHDPCYLGRHNQVYEPPRDVLDAIPGLKRVEMKRCRDRSFCCGGGGLMLFYEPKEGERMGVVRVRMAADAGANIIVTACPFCLANIEDAIKVAGLEGKMSAIDLAELADRQIARPQASSGV